MTSLAAGPRARPSCLGPAIAETYSPGSSRASASASRKAKAVATDPGSLVVTRTGTRCV